MSFLSNLPNATLLDVFQRWPEHTGRLHAYLQHLMRDPSPLSESERELIATFVSRLNNCAWCEMSHAVGYRIVLLRRWEISSFFRLGQGLSTEFEPLDQGQVGKQLLGKFLHRHAVADRQRGGLNDLSRRPLPPPV